MRRHLVSRSWLLPTAGCSLLLLLAGCVAPPTAPGVSAAASVPAGSARIWFYRDYAPSVSRTLAPVALNGRASGYVMPGLLGLLAGAIGDRDAAFAHFEKGIEERSLVISWLRDPVLDGIRDDPRYAELFARVGLAP